LLQSAAAAFTIGAVTAIKGGGRRTNPYYLASLLRDIPDKKRAFR